MSDILINFGGDTSGLNKVVSGLQTILATESEVGQEWAKTSAKIAADTGKAADGSKKLSQSLADQVNAIKNVDKVLAGGFGKQAILELQKQLQVTGKELKGFYTSIRDNARANILAGGTIQQIKQFEEELAGATELLEQLEAAENGANRSSVSLKTQLRLMREELTRMAVAGQQDTQRFRELQAEAGELADKMADVQSRISNTGSDTKNLDGLINILQGVGGAFAIVAGAQSLFGTESEELNEVLQKTQGIMAILQGLQEVQNILQRESAANILLTASARGAETVATEASTVATTQLNTALKLNPAGILIAGIVAIVAALAIYNSSSHESAVNTKEFNDELVSTNKSTFEAQNKLAVLNERIKTAGSSFTEKEAILKEYNKEFGDTIGKAASINELERIMIERAPAYIKMLGLKARAQAASNLALKEQEKQFQAKLDYDAKQAEANSGVDVFGYKNDAARNADLDNLVETLTKSNAAIRQLTDEQIKSTKEAAALTTEFHFKSEDDKTEKTKKEGKKRGDHSKEEAKKRLEIQLAAEAELKKLKDENYLSEFSDDTQRAKEKIIQDSVNERTRINGLKINEDTRRQLLTALRQKETDALYAIDKKAADDKAAAEKTAEQNRMAGALGQLARLQEIGHNKELADLESLYKRKLISEEEYLKRKAKLTGDYSDLEAFQAKQLTDSITDDLQKRAAAFKSFLTILQTGINATLGTNGFSVALNSLNSFAVLAEDVFARIKTKAITAQQGFQELAAAALSSAQATTNQIFADEAAGRQRDLADRLANINEARQQELDNTNLTEQNKSDIKKRFDERERQAKRKAYEDDRQAKINQALINGALAITTIFAQTPKFDFGVATFILAGIAAATTAAQVAFIRSQPIPKFRKGKKRGEAVPGSGWAIVDDGGQREPIVRADGSIEYFNGRPKERLTFLHRDDTVFPSMEAMFKAYKSPAMPAININTPQMAEMPKNLHTNNHQSGGIDIEKFADLVATKLKAILPAAVHVHNTMDKEGVRQWIEDGRNKTEHKNRRWSINP